MLSRLIWVIVLAIAFFFGFAVGSSPLADWGTDFLNMLCMTWDLERSSRGPGGSGPMLVAGFLLGQGLFLAARRLVSRFEPARARRIERVAAWDNAMQLGTRFGLHRYLEHCAIWASEDPTARTQTIGLFKVGGLGKLNDRVGTLIGTQLLKRIAVEVRSAALPESVSVLRRWYWHYLPQAISPRHSGIPVARYPARWSGATFALAFRELDAFQAVTICRNVTIWIQRELESSCSEEKPTLSVAIVVGTAGLAGRSLAGLASCAINGANAETIRVLLDPADTRAEPIAQLNSVEVIRTGMQAHSELGESSALALKSESAMERLRFWSPPLGCLVGAAVLLALTGGKAHTSTAYPWPDTLEGIQLVDSSGPRTVPLVRSSYRPSSSPNWRVSDVVVTQGDISGGEFNAVQLHVTVTNTSQYTYFLSAFDFCVADDVGHSIPVDPLRTLRMARGLSGRWLRPGESWSGWLVATRQAQPITSLRFEPDRTTRLELTGS